MSLKAYLEQAAEVFAQTDHALAQSLTARLMEASAQAIDPSPSHVPALAHLPDAVSAVDAHPLVRRLAAIVETLPWQEADRDSLSEHMAGRYGFVEILGPAGMIESSTSKFGLFLQSPNTYYPPHKHAAEELYFVLSGTAAWQRGNAPFADRPPCSLIHHRPWDLHAMQTREAPLLAMWAWFGDLSFESYRLVLAD